MRILVIALCALLAVACKQQGRVAEPEQQEGAAQTAEVATGQAEEETAGLAEAAEDDAVEEQPIRQMAVCKYGNRRVYLEKKGYSVYCYVDSQRVSFGDSYIDDGAHAMYAHPRGRHVYVVGDIVPNSNGWTVRFPLYRLDISTLETKHLGDFAAISFGRNGFKAAVARLTNPDAECTADERYAIHDNYYDYNGRLLRKGKGEYGYDNLERIYGDTLVNARGFHYGE